MKKVGFVMAHMGIGGNERSVANITKAISNSYEIFLLPFDGSKVAFEYDGKIIDLSVPAADNTFKRLVNSFKRVYRLKKIIKREKIDILFCLTSHKNVVSHYPFRNCKKIVSCRDTGNLIKNITQFHHMLLKADLMVMNSFFMADYYLSYYPKDKHKVAVVNNIVRTERIKELSNETVETKFINFTKTHFTVVAVGRFCEEKGLNNLLRIFEIFRSENSNAGLVLIGDGYLSKRIREMVGLSKYKNDILLLGYQNNPYKYMSRCNVFALSSISEGFPNVIIEAMSCKLPVVATDCKSGPNEILNDNYNYHMNLKQYYRADYGVLAPELKRSEDFNYEIISNEEKQFAEALGELAKNEKLRTYYSNKSLERSEFFSSDVAKEKLNSFLNNL